jgi:serine/threonine protein phosphatase PrpC
MYVANVGDSRAVLCKHNGDVIAMTNDHKADRPDEILRIRAAGGFVVHKRVMGELAISRAIGDVDFKETGFLFVLAEPELFTHQLMKNEQFILLACDGLFDVLTNEQACEFIRTQLSSRSIQDCSERIVTHCIDKLYTRDNVTAIIVRLTFSSSSTSTSTSTSTIEQVHISHKHVDSDDVKQIDAHAHDHDDHDDEHQHPTFHE